MMLRYLEPQVQLAANKVNEASQLPYFAVHIPIKSPSFSLSELERLEGAPYWLLAEHFLVVNVLQRLMSSIETLVKSTTLDTNCINRFYSETIYLAENLGCSSANHECNSPLECIRSINRIFDTERLNAKSYISQLSFVKGLLPYESPLLGYEDFFLPFIRLVKDLSITPKGPIYLMLDDADNLPVRMQKIINSWVSYRTTDDVCLKISTQQKYKTWRTNQGALIESSHDFSEIDISAVYTSKNFSHYYDRIESVVRRRLEISGFDNTDPETFFPENQNQKEAIEKVKEKISEDWKNGKNRSSRKHDDVTRYYMSEYIKELAKNKKTNTLSYAGFKNIVNISSGMIRFFLEPASRMYAELLAIKHDSSFTQIPTDIQDRVLYKWSEEYVLEEFNKLKRDETTIDSSNSNKVEKLKTLINSLGQLFQAKLVSSDSERRYISFMITDTVPTEVQEVLDLAIEWGYLNQKTIARKEGVGRNIQYTLNRRLAPHFKLDPSGYAAHMSITPDMIKLAMENTQSFVRERLKNKMDDPISSGAQSTFDFEAGEDDA
jgi:hypothetical protein